MLRAHVFVQEWGASASGFDLAVGFLPSAPTFLVHSLHWLARLGGPQAILCADGVSYGVHILGYRWRGSLLLVCPSPSQNLFSPFRFVDHTGLCILERARAGLEDVRPGSHAPPPPPVPLCRRSCCYPHPQSAYGHACPSTVIPSTRPSTESTAAHPCHLPKRSLLSVSPSSTSRSVCRYKKTSAREFRSRHCLPRLRRPSPPRPTTFTTIYESIVITLTHVTSRTILPLFSLSRLCSPTPDSVVPAAHPPRLASETASPLTVS